MISPTTITATSSPTPATATIPSSVRRRAPVAPLIASAATSAITIPAVTISPPASVNPEKIGVR